MHGELRRRFFRFTRRHRLVSAGDRVLVAVSGGVDSMVLLHLLRDTAPELGIAITAAHFDHGMRPHSAADADWLAGVCAAWQVPLIARRAPQALHGETAARTARYAFLSQAMREVGARRIATAHHADDQIETVLYRVLRGTGMHGLAGIPVRRGPIIRPLLRFRKTELVDYAVTHDIGVREDPTNETDRFVRNRIRRALIPVMVTVQPQSPEAVLALARHAARAERAWRSLLGDARRRLIVSRAADVSQLALKVLQEYDGEIQARLLRGELRRFGVVPDRAATRGMLQFVAQAGSGSSYVAGGGLRLERAYEVLRITRERAARVQATLTISNCNDGAGEATIGGKRWHARWTTSRESAGGGERFDCAALRFPVELRGWVPGDRIRLPYGSKKLKKLFAEARVAFHQRASVPILVDADGRVCWVVGVARSVLAPPAQDTPALTITVTHAERS